jgi:hypothetical protein
MTTTEDRLRQAIRIRAAAYLESTEDLGYGGFAEALGTGKGEIFRLLNPGAPKPKGGFYPKASLTLHLRVVDLLGLELADLVPIEDQDRPAQWHDVEAMIHRLYMGKEDRRFLSAMGYAAFAQLRKREANKGSTPEPVATPAPEEVEELALPTEPVAAPKPDRQIQEPLPKILPPEDNGLGIGGEWTWLISLCAGPNADSTTRSSVAAFLSRDWELIQAEVDKTQPATEQARNAGIKAMAIRYWRQEARSLGQGQSDTSRAVSDALDGL